MQSNRNHGPGSGLGSGSGSAKRPRQRQLQLGGGLMVDDTDSSNKKRERFQPCPVCNRTFALFRLEDHVNQCLDSPPGAPCRSSSSSSASTVSDHGNSSPLLLPSPAAAAANLLAASATLLHTPPSSSPCQPRLEQHAPGSLTGDAPCLASATAESESESRHYIKENCGIRKGEGCGMEQHPSQTPAGAGRGGSLGSAEEGEVNGNGEGQNEGVNQFRKSSLLARNKSITVRDYGNMGGAKTGGRIEEGRNQDRHLIGHGITKDLIDGNGRTVGRPPAGFKLFQKQVQSQARLSMFNKFSPSANLQRKPTVTVLQPGMVLFRSCLDLETQQKFVMESQDVEHLFHRATTSGGGKYHVYSMCWGPVSDFSAYPQLSGMPEQPLPPWMFTLAQKLALDAHHHSAVCSSGCEYGPDVVLANFYPAKADELGVIGLGGHQDLNDNNLMPVVSVSVGDSMTFFYRRLPPLSRRKSGIAISVDEKAARSCKDGDTAHNREHQILLESGDVLVFGGESRLVYHGTRNVQPGTRPPGLHMVPGRLNFTFRQTR